MALLALEIHDTGIRAKRAGHETVIDSPGFAMVDGTRLLTGRQARASARLRPRHVDSRFWGELSTAPLPAPFPEGLSRADLAHAHLETVWRQACSGVDDAILITPGSYTDEQLGLLLGIARACRLPVAGLVDAAVAACPTDGQDSQLLHLDLQLHRAVLTELVHGSTLARREVRVAANVGLASLHDTWVRSIAERFVRETRFDPLHLAPTEQQLYDAIPGLLEELREGERSEVTIDVSGKHHRVEVTRRQMVESVLGALDAVSRLVGQLARAGRPSRVLLSHRAAALPDLRHRLGELGDVKVAVLAPDAPMDGVLRNQSLLRSDGPAFALVTSLPTEGTVVPGVAEAHVAPPPRARGGLPPTHLLYEGRAHPLGEQPLVLGIGVPDHRRVLRLTGTTAGISRSHCSLVVREGRAVIEDHSRHGSFLNGQRVEGAVTLVTGDRLRLGAPGIELQLIRVVDDDGATQT